MALDHLPFAYLFYNYVSPYQTFKFMVRKKPKVLSLEDIIDLANTQYINDVSQATNQRYKQGLKSQYGWIKFLEVYNRSAGTTYSLDTLNASEDVLVDLFKVFFTIKALLGNENDIGFESSRNGKCLSPCYTDVIHGGLIKYYDRKELLDKDKTFKNPMRFVLFSKFYSSMQTELKKQYKKSGLKKHLVPLYYNDMRMMIELSYNENFIRKFDYRMGYWFRAWSTLAFHMFMRGQEITDLRFRNLRKGICPKGIECLLFTYQDRKSMEAYGNEEVTFHIYPTPDEPWIDCHKYISEYFDLIDKLGVQHHSEDFVFPNMGINY
jgi:hypothetical protein